MSSMTLPCVPLGKIGVMVLDTHVPRCRKRLVGKSTAVRTVVRSIVIGPVFTYPKISHFWLCSQLAGPNPGLMKAIWTRSGDGPLLLRGIAADMQTALSTDRRIRGWWEGSISAQLCFRLVLHYFLVPQVSCSCCWEARRMRLYRLKASVLTQMTADRWLLSHQRPRKAHGQGCYAQSNGA